MAWTAPRTWVAGEVVTAATMNAHVRDNLKAIGDPWIAYTPTISGVGTSSVSARYVAQGKRVEVEFGFTLTGAPNGSVTISLPLTATGSTGFVQSRGSATGLRQGVAYYHGSVFLQTTSVVAILSSGAGSPWGPGQPVAWGNTDQWGGFFSYEAA